jgi:hypothetical protein
MLIQNFTKIGEELSITDRKLRRETQLAEETSFGFLKQLP